MSGGFGINTNIFETNLLNLAVVVRVVVSVVGDRIRSLLEQRRQNVMAILQDVDVKAKAREQQLLDARNALKTAQNYAQEIRIQALLTAESERSLILQQLKRELKRIQERGDQVVQIEYLRTIQDITRRITQLALSTTEKTLRSALDPNGPSVAKQKELNAVHVRETFRQLKGWSTINRITHKKFTKLIRAVLD
jgi:F-type H+-transporting ATPase subunit b